MELNLKGKKALVTGASRGIGAAVAGVLAAEGCDLYLTARNAELLERVAQDLRSKHGSRVVAIARDLESAAAVRELAGECQDADILINNAGAIPGGRLDDIDDEEWRRVWEVKVFGYINLCRSFFGSMCARKQGVIANIIGASGQRPKANYICGATANAALMAFTEALGGDSLEHGVRVLGINPGPVATERLVELMRTSARDKFGDAERWQELLAPLPQKRAATVDEVAFATVFAVSELSSYTSGTIITVDGGYCNRGSLM
ncbi:MAG: SDR family NAD(P)-dependent oxidoreductase [Betaproteobacteria bacterium]|nr:SDR family NAD(P)-dependent oxidoreductase [Betaproteobacteria bacterium]